MKKLLLTLLAVVLVLGAVGCGQDGGGARSGDADGEERTEDNARGGRGAE